MKRSNYECFSASIAISFLCFSASVAFCGENPSETRIKFILENVRMLEDALESSEISFQYSTQTHEKSIAFFKARALRVTPVAQRELPENRGLFDDKTIVSRKNKIYDSNIEIFGTMFKSNVSITDEGGRRVTDLIYDGNRYAISNGNNEWYLVSSDLTPIANPIDVIKSLPRIFYSIPMNRAVMSDRSFTFSKWLKESYTAGSFYSISPRIFRFFLSERGNQGEINESGFVAEIEVSEIDNVISNVRVWRIHEKEIGEWKKFSPKEYNFQIISFDNYQDVFPGIKIPLLISVKYRSRFRSILSSLSEVDRNYIIDYSGIEDLDKTFDILTHRWKIKKVSIDHKGGSKLFQVPQDSETSIYDYLTENWLQ